MIRFNTALTACLLSIYLQPFAPSSWGGQPSAAVFILNPSSRSGQSHSMWQQFEKNVLPYYFYPYDSDSDDAPNSQSLLPYELFITKASGEATNLAQKHYESWKSTRKKQEEDTLLIVGVGGDGTISEIAQGLEKKDDLLLGVLPFGTGNDIARTLGIPLNDTHASAQILASGTAVEYGAYQVIAEKLEANSESSDIKIMALDEVDIGLTARGGLLKQRHDCGEEPNCLLRLTPRPLIYPVANVAIALRYKHPRLIVTTDDKTQTSQGVAVMSCGSTCGGGIAFNPDMTPQQQKGSLALTDGQRLLSHFWTMGKLALNARTPEIRRIKFNRAEFKTPDGEPPVNLQIDGEPFYQTPATVTWVPSAYRFQSKTP